MQKIMQRWKDVKNDGKLREEKKWMHKGQKATSNKCGDAENNASMQKMQKVTAKARRKTACRNATSIMYSAKKKARSDAKVPGCKKEMWTCRE